MTNDEAIKYLIRPVATSTGSSNEYLKQKEAYDLAIKALNTQESLEKKIEFLMNETPKGECCGSCYLCDVGDCGAKLEKGGAE